MKLQRFKVLLDGDFPCPSIQAMENGDILPLQSLEIVMAEDVAILEDELKTLRAKLARHENDGTTHAAGCLAWGPKHYECALAEIERLKALERNKWMIYGKLVGPLTPPKV